MDNRVEKLVSAISRLRDFAHTQDDIKAVKEALDLIFLPDARCMNFVYTVNTDKLPFGCIVFPVLDSSSINNFMITGEGSKINAYEIELDSKVFDYGLSDEEVAAVMLYNIYHMISSTTPMDRVRELVDDYFTLNGNCLIMKDSIEYQAILAFGLLDALVQFTSCLNLPTDVVSDPFLDSLDIDCINEALTKLFKEIPGCENITERQPNLSMLNWALRLYSDVDKERIPAINLINKCKELTASALYITKMNSVLAALNRIDTSAVIESMVESVMLESKRKNGLLAQLKYNGLRDIESDLYEFMIRTKNAETEEDVYYALKQINARLAILDDYIRENQDDEDIDRWIALKMKYIEIRDELAKKKLTRHSYGLFIDYNALDKLDENENLSEACLQEFLFTSKSKEKDKDENKDNNDSNKDKDNKGFKIINVKASDKSTFETLYNNEALTAEGMTIKDDQDAINVCNWFRKNSNCDADVIDLFIIKGKDMNSFYHLTTNNKYPNDLTIVCIDWYYCGCKSPYKGKFRYFSDVVDNNARREIAKKNPYYKNYKSMYD